MTNIAHLYYVRCTVSLSAVFPDGCFLLLTLAPLSSESLHYLYKTERKEGRSVENLIKDTTDYNVQSFGLRAFYYSCVAALIHTCCDLHMHTSVTVVKP